MAELSRRISERELAEWIAYYGLEPWGEERADLRAGIVASTVANTNRGGNNRAHKPSDFMPKFDLTGEQVTDSGKTANLDVTDQVRSVLELFSSNHDSES